MGIQIFNNWLQLYPPVSEKELQQAKEHLIDNPGKVLRLLWFKECDDFTFLSKLALVTSISISYSDVKDLEFLSCLPDLRYLDINETNGIQDLSVLTKLSKITFLNLDFSSNYKKLSLEPINHLRKLKELSWKGNFKQGTFSYDFLELEILIPKIKDIELRRLHQLKRLHTLQIRSQKVESFCGIEACKNLKSISLTGLRLPKQDSLSALFSAPAVEKLLITGVNGLKDFSFISEDSEVNDLALGGMDSLETLKGLERLRKLHTLVISGRFKYRNSFDFSVIHQMKELRKAELSLWSLNRQALAACNYALAKAAAKGVSVSKKC